MVDLWRGFATILLVGSLASLYGCAFFGTGPNDARVFLARYNETFLDLDRSFPSDPHSLEGYSISDASEVSYPSIIGSGFDARREFYALVLDREFTGEVSVFPFLSRGNPRAGRELDYDIDDVSLRMNDAIVTTSGTLVAVGQTKHLVDSIGRDRRDFLIVSTTPLGARIATFGIDGRIETGFPKVTTTGEIPTNDFATHAVASSGGFYAVGGRADDVISGDTKAFAIAKYTDAGALDVSFSGDGKLVMVPMGAREVGVGSIALDSSGRLLVAGTATYGDGSTRHVIARHTARGILDRTFGADGWIIFSRSSDAEVIKEITPMSGYTLAMLSSGAVRALADDGTDYRRFGDAIAGSTARTALIAVAGRPVSLLATSTALYVLEIRDRTTFLNQYSPSGDRMREKRVGLTTALFPDSDFLGAELATDGTYIYVVGLVQ